LPCARVHATRDPGTVARDSSLGDRRKS
jgi:hypothetical protein